MTKPSRNPDQDDLDEQPAAPLTQSSHSSVDLPLIPVDEYWPANDASFEGNHLITAWPHLSDEVLADQLNRKLEYSPAQCNAPISKKRELLASLSEFFLPLDDQLNFAMRVWTFIIRGYAARNPCRSKTAAERFKALCRGISSGKIDPKRVKPTGNSPWVMTLLGLAGTGKSTTIKHLLREMSQGGLLHHWKLGEVFQLLSVSITLSEGSDRFSIVRSVYRELMVAARSTGLPVIYAGTKPRTIHDYEDAVRILVRKLNVGVLILDEVQWLFGGTKKHDDSAMQFLTSLSETLGLPLLVIGTWKSLSHLSSEMCLGRRAAGPDSGRFYRIARGKEWKLFLRALWRYQYTTQAHPLDDLLINLFYELTQGVQDLTVKLYAAVQLRCIENDEPLTACLVCEVAHTLFTTVLVDLQRLRDGIAEDTIELAAKTKEEFDLAHELSLQRIAFFASAGDSGAAADRGAGASPTSSSPAATSSPTAQTPTTAPPDAAKAGQGSGAPVPKLRRPSAVNKTTAATDSTFAALPDDDLRKLAYFTWKNKQTVIDAVVEDSFHWSFAMAPQWDLYGSQNRQPT